MIHLDFQMPNSVAWTNWLAEAKTATANLILAGPPYVFNETLYKKQRDAIFSAYYDKCAYCEGDYNPVMKGNVEHYRPKGAVRHADNRTVKIMVNGVQQDHPGYFWLAYDYTNLLPACSLCNSHFKRDIFPVVGPHACTPGAEALESPLLLHPRIDDPETRLVFSPKTGILGFKTDAAGRVDEAAKVSIDIYNLNRDGLPQSRLKAYKHVRQALNSAMTQYAHATDLDGDLKVLQDHRSGRAPYALAGRYALQELRGPIDSLFSAFKPIFQL